MEKKSGKTKGTWILMKVIMIFLDGVGIGKPAQSNPLSDPDLKIFSCSVIKNNQLPENGEIIATDASLGIKGLPQSATGQTTLLTGINAAKLLGRHVPGFPDRKLREIILKESIFIKLKSMGKSGTFINTFRPLFFSIPKSLRYRLSVTTVAALSAYLCFYNLDDLKNDKSIYHDFTNKELLKRGFLVPVFSPEHAADILTRQAQNFDFTLYEYFLTDKAGHKKDYSRAKTVLEQLDDFLKNIIEKSDLNNTSIIVTSDHGNIEDMSVKTHTTNPVLTMVWGKGTDLLIKRIKSLTDITPAILELIDL